MGKKIKGETVLMTMLCRDSAGCAHIENLALARGIFSDVKGGVGCSKPFIKPLVVPRRKGDLNLAKFQFRGYGLEGLAEGRTTMSSPSELVQAARANQSCVPLFKAGCLLAALLSWHPAAAETLQEALANAYLINPALNAQRAALRATDEQVAIAYSGLRPTITAGANTAFQNVDNEVSHARTGIGAAAATIAGGRISHRHKPPTRLGRDADPTHFYGFSKPQPHARGQGDRAGRS